MAGLCHGFCFNGINDEPFFLQESNDTIPYERRPVKRSRNDMTMWECSASYMRVMHYNYSESTKDGLWRRYKRITKDIYVLAQMGKLSTIVPEKMMKEDIHNYLLYRRSFGVSDSEMEHELSALSKIFEYVGNPNFSNALKEFPYLRTTCSHKKLPPMEEPEWRAILSTLFSYLAKNFRF